MVSARGIYFYRCRLSVAVIVLAVFSHFFFMLDMQAQPQHSPVPFIEELSQLEKIKSQVEDQFASGSIFLQDGKLQQAESYFEKALAIDSGHILSSAGLAKTQWLLGKRQAALASYNHALKIVSKNNILLTLRGKLLYEMGDTAWAIKSFEAALQSNGSLEWTANAMFWLAKTFIKQGDGKRGLDMLEKAKTTVAKALKKAKKNGDSQSVWQLPRVETQYLKAMAYHLLSDDQKAEELLTVAFQHSSVKTQLKNPKESIFKKEKLQKKDFSPLASLEKQRKADKHAELVVSMLILQAKLQKKTATESLAKANAIYLSRNLNNPKLKSLLPIDGNSVQTIDR